MAEPQTRSDPTEAKGEGPLADAASRLERALASLEAALKRTVAEVHAGGDASDEAAALSAELATTKARAAELEDAGAHASQALGRAMEEVQTVLALDAAASSQGELDFALETNPASDDEAEAADDPPREGPAG